MLSHVSNRSVVKMDLLPDPKLVNSFYGNQGVPENRAELIAKNYYKKYVMLKEFQQGKTISLYHEKNEAK